MWDLEGALTAGEVPTSWRLASTYRVELIEPGDPVVLWRTRGWTGPAGVVAAGTVIERPDRCELQPGDVDDHRWVSPAARDRPRPRVEVVLALLVRPVEVERTDGVQVLRDLEVRRVPRIGNPSVITPEQWQALEALINR